MILWLDAQLPPALAVWLRSNFGITAVPLRDIGLRDADDLAIFEAARDAGATIVSKDADFVEIVQRLGPPPQLIWVTCGNVTNERLQHVFGASFKQTMDLLQAGNPIVEVADLT